MLKKFLIYFVSTVALLVIGSRYLKISDNDTQIEQTMTLGNNFLKLIKKWAKFIPARELFNYCIEAINDRKFNGDNLKVDYVKFKNIDFIVFNPIKLTGKKRKTILYIHGGGWVHFSAKSFSNVTGEIAKSLNAVVISINYRKAPQHPYPRAVSDVRRAAHFILEHHRDFRIDLTTLTIMGDSAGGNLAMALCYELHREREKYLRIDSAINFNLVLLSPTLQMFDFDTPSFRENTQDLLIKRQDMCNFVCLYTLGRKHEDECIEYVCTNAHIQKETHESGFMNTNWQNYLKGPDYHARTPSSFPHIHNTDKSRQLLAKHPEWVPLYKKNLWSSYLKKPTYSPLSALNDKELLAILPRNILVFNSLKDPLRDDARLLVQRVLKASSNNNLTEPKNIKLFELDTFHDPISLLTVSHSKSWEQLRFLKVEYDKLMREQ